MEVTDESILDYYYHGWELSKAEQKFPDWFYNETFKQACLLGYCDQDLGAIKENTEILKEINGRS